MKLNIAQISVIAIFLISLVTIIFLVKSEDVISSECIIIEEKESKKIDILFIGNGYSNKEKFLNNIDDYVYGEFGFKNIEPFKTHFDKINFYGILSDEVNCPIQSDTLICDDFSTKKVASKCPHDYIFVLNDRNVIKDFVVPVRSSAYLNIASINTADHELVVLHEFAHIFRNLADEYVEDNIHIDVDDFDNCDHVNCPSWDDFDGANCYKGCSMPDYYRSIETGIMKNYIKSKEYGKWDEHLLSERLL